MLKKQIFGLGFSLASIFFLASAGSLQSYEAVSDFSLTAGWRDNDVDATFESASGPTKLKFHDLNVWQFGFRGQYAFTGFCGCEESWLDQFYIKGSALWGWGSDGHVRQDSDFTYDYTSSPKHKTDDTRSYDYSIGLGWMYPVDCNWAIGPTVGYDWNRLTTKGKHHSNNNSGYEYGYDYGYDYGYEGFGSGTGSNSGLDFESKWNGPWLGLELAYQDCDWHFDLGYEFHWARNTSTYTPATSTYGDVYGSAYGSGYEYKGNRKKSHGKVDYGNVVYLDATYEFCECWELGLGFKYTYFKGKHKHNSNNGSNDEYYGYTYDYGYGDEGVAGSESSNRNKGNKWMAWGVTVDLGYRF